MVSVENGHRADAFQIASARRCRWFPSPFADKPPERMWAKDHNRGFRAQTFDRRLRAIPALVVAELILMPPA